MAAHDSHTRSIRIVAFALSAAIVCALGVWGVNLVRTQMLNNSQRLGVRLAQAYGDRELAKLDSYELFLAYGAGGLNDLIDAGSDAQTMHRWLANLANGMQLALGENTTDPYAVVDGEIVAANPWEGDADYDFASTSWYTGALDAGGQLAATDAYLDAITGKRIVTVSVALHGTGNVLAFDIDVRDLSGASVSAADSDGAAYVLFDRSGGLLACSGDLDSSDPAVSDYLERLHAGVISGELLPADATIKGPRGRTLSVFSTELTSGWLSIVTIPTDSLLTSGGVTPGFIALCALCLALVGVATLTLIRERRSGRAVREASDTVRILGNTYFAIYRINYIEGTYTTVKSSPDTARVMGASGTYTHFMDVLKTVVDESTFDQFSESFSCESIRRREEEGVIEFGGRYLRRFGNDLRWVAVSSITNDEVANGEAIICFRSVDGAMREEMQRQELLESALETARQATRRQQIFFSNISHDMRTPLNAIINLTKMARADLDDRASAEHYLDLLDQAGAQLVTLVNDVLDMSQIEYAEQSVLNLEPINLVACARTAVDLASPVADRERKTIEFAADEPTYWVRGDERRLGQILNNLISNALKYSHEGARVDVRVGVAESQPDEGRKTRLFHIEVEDTGIGMTPEFLERIFDPFARETIFAPAGVVGTGLGMPIVKSLVQQMGGEITVASELGRGSTFTLAIPFEVVDSPAATDGSVDGGVHETNEPVPSFDGRHVLVAEDNETNLLITEALLQALGVTCACVRDGAQAVEAMADSTPGTFDAILMDMQMPVLDGCGAAREIRASGRPDAASIPIIAVTANAFAEDVAATRAAGMDGYVTKPIDAQALADALARAWSR